MSNGHWRRLRTSQYPRETDPGDRTDTLVAGNHFLPDIDPADLRIKHWR